MYGLGEQKALRTRGQGRSIVQLHWTRMESRGDRENSYTPSTIELMQMFVIARRDEQFVILRTPSIHSLPTVFAPRRCRI